ncbi:hypothetical protein CRUP_029647 [Coryphaenoides rupestris]|nr:hypothetical protein CRUP_029647 [Coryphaenoides rupestris]
MIVEEDFETDEESRYGRQDLEHDLHLAAQLGKTLLDRNHELEQALQHMYTTNDEQLQGIEHLKQQVELLRQMNEQHAKVYEQLDLVARDLEHSNQRLDHMEDLQAQVEKLQAGQAEHAKRQLGDQRRTLGAQSHLSKQVELLRQMNEQHAKVYEQLDLVARDLEHSNQRLVTDNRLAQHRISSLTDTVDGLQDHMEDLQAQVEKLQAGQAEHAKRQLGDQRRTLGAQSVSCLKELYDLHQDRGSWMLDPERGPDQVEERATLRRSVQTLQSQVGVERSRREVAERETEVTAREKGALEERLAQLESCWARQAELEAEVEDMRLLWRTERASSTRLLPDTVFFSLVEDKPSQDRSEDGEEEEEEANEKEEEKEKEAQERQRGKVGRPRCSSDSFLRGALAEEFRRSHDPMCIRRAEAVKQRGVSLLNEVKYEELLQQCQQGSSVGGLSHKAVQTPSSSPQVVGPRARQPPPDPAASEQGVTPLEDAPQAEYKVLFKEIFSRIQKTKDDLSENHQRARSEGPPPPALC